MEKQQLKVENIITQHMFKKATNLKIPLSGTFELSPVCNFDCKMCYVRKTQKEVNDSTRSIMTCEEWITLAKQMKEEGMLYLLLTGGEPFLWPDFWKLYEELSKMGFVISINSNGSLINEEVISKLLEIPPSRINITLYGASDATYEKLCGSKNVFSKITHTIDRLLEVGIAVKLNCSLTPLNKNDMEEIINFASTRNLVLDMATYMFPPVRKDETKTGENTRFTPEEAAYYNLKRYRLTHSEESYIAYLQGLLKGIAAPLGLDESCYDPVDGKLMCRAGKATFWVTWDGWLTPCGLMVEPKIDIRKQLFKDSWNKLVKVCEEITLTGVCASCPNKKICHYCAAASLAETGSFTGIPTYLCEEMEAVKKMALDELNSRGIQLGKIDKGGK